VGVAHLAAAARRGDGEMLLNPDDYKRIEQAVSSAELTTRGEIVCVVAEEASTYLEVPLAWAAAVAIALPLLVLALSNFALNPDVFAWGWRAAHVGTTHTNVIAALGAYSIGQSILFITILVLASIPGVRRFLTPASLKRGHVHHRALEQFVARNLHNTCEHTGVLIYASLTERCAEVLADSGINAKVPAETWDNILASLVDDIKKGTPGDGFVTAIENCGRVLAEHFPAQGPKPNELPNAIIEI